MATVATLDTVMRLNSTAFRQGMIEAAAQANRSLGSIQKQAAETASVLLSLKRAANAAGSLYLVKEGLGSLVDAQKQLQAINYTFQAATGSAGKAGEALAFVRDEAERLGLVIPDSAEGFAKLSASATAAGVSMADQKALFDAYAKSATTLHLSTTQSSRALLALEQMFAKGKIQAQELRLQLGQAIPGAAMRFQNAVLEMTKGTDLAGKSFDQLLEAGDLTTSKFLPALVKALQDSGRGWEDASHGLQAELNRVQTAWFNLKTEVSGGLFGDAVTVGARALANNLASIANAVSIIGAGALARTLGSGLAVGAGKAQRWEQEIRGSKMAAAAEREAAEATAAQAAAEAEQARRQAQGAQSAQAAVRQIRTLNAERLAGAEIQRRMAQDTIATANAEVQRTGALIEVVRTRSAFEKAADMAHAEAAQAAAAADALRAKTAAQLSEAWSSQSASQRQAAALSQENARAQRALAAADLDLARAKAFAAAEDPVILELTARRDAAATALTASETQLTKAIAAEAEATRVATALKAQAVEADNAVTAANIRLAAAEDAVAAAQARVAAAREAELAANSLAAAVRGAAKSFGNFALGLAGGPWGAAVLAIGALGYAFYSVRKASEDYRAETREQVQSLDTLRTQVQAATVDYGKLHSAMNGSQALDLFTNSSQELAKAKTELRDLQQQAAELQHGIESRASGGANASTALLDWFDQRKLNDVNDRIAQLQGRLVGAGADVDALGSKMNLFVPAVDAVKGALERLKAGASLKEILSGMSQDFSDGQAAIDKAKADAEAGMAALTAQGKSWAKKAATEGKSAVEQAKYDLEQVITNIKASGLTAQATAKAIAQARAEAAKPLAQAAAADAADQAKKAKQAAEQQAEAYRNLTASQDGQIETLQAQADGTAKATAAQRALNTMLAGGNAEFRKLTAAEQAEVIAKQQKIVVLEAEVAKTQLAAAAAKQLADLDRQLAEQQAAQARTNERTLEGMSHGSRWNAEQAALEQLNDSYRRMREQADRSYESSVAEATASGRLAEVQGQLDDTHAQALGRITLAEQQAILAQRQFFDEQHAMMGDWTVGAKSALEDYQDKAADVASASKDLFSNAFQGMEDALVSFVTTGKADFKGLVKSILSDLARIELRIIASRILTSIIGAVLPGGAGAGAPVDSWNSGGVDYSSFGSGGGGSFSLAGGRASGGPVAGGNLYEVAEGGKPELLTTGGRTYLMMGQQGGYVTPAGGSGGGGSGGAPVVNISSTVVVNSDGNAQSKVSGAEGSNFARELDRRVRASVQQIVADMLRPGGMIYNEVH